ncbi:MAG: ABC transporter permease, partial [Aggregatilineales bacterium]
MQLVRQQSRKQQFNTVPPSRWHIPAKFRAGASPYLTILTLIIVLLVLLPVAYLLLRSIGAGQESIDYLLKPRTLSIISNSIVLVFAVTISATVIGVPFAWFTTRTDIPFRRMWLILGLLPMVVPSYLAAVTYLAAFGEKGMLQQLLEPLIGTTSLPDIKGFFGAWLAITLFTYPYILLPVRAALLNADPALEEAGQSMGLNRWQIFRRITLPQLRPALAGGMLLISLYTLSDFGAVAVMRYNAFTRAIEQQVSSFRMERAAVLALVLVAFTLILLIMERVIASNKQNYRAGTGVKRDFKITRLGIWRIPAILFCSIPVFIGVIVPVMVLFSWVVNKSQVANVPPADINALLVNTGSVSLIAAFIIALLAIAPALLATRSTSRRNRWLVGLTYTGNILPGIVIALALVYFSSKYMIDIYQTLPLLILGYATRFLP